MDEAGATGGAAPAASAATRSTGKGGTGKSATRKKPAPRRPAVTSPRPAARDTSAADKPAASDTSAADKPAASDTSAADKPVATTPAGVVLPSSGQPATGNAAAGARPRHLASAVFVQGSEPLQRGMRYQLAIFGDDLCITGFINSLPDRQIFARRLRDVRTTAEEDRLIVTGTSGGHEDLHLVFDAVRDETAKGLPAELAALWPAPDADATGVAR